MPRLLALAALLALLAAPALAQSYAGDVSENRYNPSSLLSPSNPYSQQGDTSSIDSYVETYRGGDLKIYSNDGKYLGKLYGNDAVGRYAHDSVTNKYGQYGSKYAPNSIRNPYGQYGSKYSPNSVRNPYASSSSVPKAFDQNPGLSWGARNEPSRGSSALPALPSLPSLDPTPDWP